MNIETKPEIALASRNPFQHLANWFRALKGVKESDADDEDLLEPLLPHPNPETYQNYAGAFRTILEKDVSCVAVTGPYGSGKTSLINKFRQKHSDQKFITISLATFEDDERKEQIDADDIQRSILQQLIYGVGEKKLEYSRFKRIRKPSFLLWKAIALCLFAVVTGGAILYWDKVEEFTIGLDLWWEYLVAVFSSLAWLALFIVVVRGVLKASAGQSIRKFSLKNAEIETEQESEVSVFNKNLDEIIYFFQETPCDVLVIEDLDRFNKTEIFTKICEVNRLVNENETIKRKRPKPIVFLFAIRDELFAGDERTKIFDLLIPVIPFVSAGNAYDVLHNKLKNAGLRDELKTRFLREVSVYVTDHRYLVNIVNEYAIYRRNLHEPNLDPNKLFAVILYKVFYPDDFGKLHKNEGALAELVKDLHEQRRNKREALSEELEAIDGASMQTREGELSSREALVCAYMGAVSRKMQEPIRGFQPARSGSQTNWIDDPSSILTRLQEDKEIRVITARGSMQNPISVASLAEIVHPGLTLKERLAEIDRIVRLREEGLAAKRTKTEQELRDVRYLPIKDAFSADELRAFVTELKHPELFVYLVAKGRLGEDYDSYTAYFHEGATTRADREFVQRFHMDDEIEFGVRIDTPSEVLLILDDGLFGKPQGFNLTIVDHVLGTEANLVHRQRLVRGLSGFPEEAFRFLEAYYTEGEHPEKLMRLLIARWADFLDAVADCKNPLPHVQEIFEKALDETITKVRVPDRFAQYIQRSAPDVFSNSRIVERLPLLAKSSIRMNDIGFPNLTGTGRSSAISQVVDHSLWKISAGNIAVILEWNGVDEKAARTAMFQSLEDSPAPVYAHVEENINDFVENCFLEVETTTEEPIEGLERLLGVEGLDEDLGKRIIARQEARIRFGEVPENYRSAIIEHEKYIINWKNFEELLETAGDFSAVAPVFQSDDTIAGLAKERRKICEQLFGFLVDFSEISLQGYQELIGPELGTIEDYPSLIEAPKKLHLIKSGMVDLSKEAYDWLAGDPSLRVALIVKQYATFDNEIENWNLGEREVAGILKSAIPLDGKRRVLRKAGTVDCAEDESLCKEVALTLTDPDTKIEDFDENFVERVIASAPQSGAIELLVCMIPKWDVARVMANLETIGTPYREIADYGKMPTIAENKVNVGLAHALEQRGFISQFKRVKRGIQIITRRSEPSE